MLAQTALWFFFAKWCKKRTASNFQNTQILVCGLPSQQARFARADADMIEHAAFLKERPKNTQKPSYS